MDMQYGISEEPNAVFWLILILFKFRLTPSGLWVNKKYVHLGASPDGLIIDPNSNELRVIIKIKCIKALRSKTIDEWIKSGVQSNACVSFIGGKLLLKINHSNYYQIQLQLLITEAPFCDFILHSKIGPPYVERIYPDIQLQQIIIENTRTILVSCFCTRIFHTKSTSRFATHNFWI